VHRRLADPVQPARLLAASGRTEPARVAITRARALRSGLNASIAGGEPLAITTSMMGSAWWRWWTYLSRPAKAI
jgi:hypothetical protein